MTRTVLVADPDPEALPAVSAALRDSEFSVIGASAHGKALVEDLHRLAPWAVAASLSLPDHAATPGFGWIATSWRLRELSPQTRVLLTFSPHQAGLVPAALAGGARAYAEKPFVREELLSALRRLASGQAAPPFFARARRVPAPLPMRWRSSLPGRTAVQRLALIRNVSVTGVRAAFQDLPPVRAVLSVEIDLPDRSVVRGRAQVVREAGLGEAGLALFALDRDSAGHLKHAVERALPG
jgi:DNA-binding NarL/FixJ family response regulator